MLYNQFADTPKEPIDQLKPVHHLERAVPVGGRSRLEQPTEHDPRENELGGQVRLARLLL